MLCSIKTIKYTLNTVKSCIKCCTIALNYVLLHRIQAAAAAKPLHKSIKNAAKVQQKVVKN